MRFQALNDLAAIHPAHASPTIASAIGERLHDVIDRISEAPDQLRVFHNALMYVFPR